MYEIHTITLGQIVGFCGTLSDDSGSCIDLQPLQEPADPELVTNLVLYRPDGPMSH